MPFIAVSNAYRYLATALCFVGSSATLAANTQLAARDLIDLSLEQLSNIIVSSVSKRDEPLARAAASIFVISADDIRRAGATSLPEALRLAPNLDVARADANQYAISARGFNGTLANKLLVLIDGRTVYTPLFSGTFWEAQDVMLEDIERIEVISGPGATLWGANAVNGVINIITRPASATQGGLITAEAGNAQYDGVARYGGTRGERHYRVYGKTLSRNNTTLTNGNPVGDDADHGQVGFRTDWDQSKDSYTFQGDAYNGDIDGLGREFSGFNLLGRWIRDLEQGSRLKVQTYFNRTSRKHTGTAPFEERLDTYDLEFQHQLKPGRHQLLWGLGIRHHDDEVENSSVIMFLPPERGINRHHLFLQDEIALRPDLDLTLGLKAETNTYSDTEFLPNARLGWMPAEGHFLWAALSRAARTPSRVDRELAIPTQVAAGSSFTSEVAKVFELGYRGQPLPQLSYSITGFYHRWQNLRTLESSPTDPLVANDREGHVQGIEAWGTWQSGQGWRLSAGFTRLQKYLRLRPGAVDVTPTPEGNDPDAWYKLRAAFDIGKHTEFDILLRHYGQRPNPQVPSYSNVDLRLGWDMARDVELSVLAQNLLNRRHPEWGAAANRAELERAVFVKLRLGLDAP